MNRLIVALTGLVTAIFGLSIITGPKFYDRLYARYWDFTEVRIPFGTALIIIGIIFIWSALRRKAKDYEKMFLICPKCEKTFNKKDVPDQLCPNCKVDLENIEGFYERHPERKVIPSTNRYDGEPDGDK
jgi:hypothetical protein